MKKIIFLLIVSILTQVNGIAQTKTGIELCIEYQKAFSSFASEKEANDALDKILDVIGASKNFTLIPCDDISNAVAVTVKGDRFILYDGAFMRKIDLATNNWSYLFILAHEVGHHINGHTRDFLLAEVLDDQSLADRRKEELEADEFASFIVSKLGAPYAQIEETIALVASDGSDLYSTHPNYDKRIAAVKRGFERADSDNSKEEKTTIQRNNDYSQNEFTPNYENPRRYERASFGSWQVSRGYPLEEYISQVKLDPFEIKETEGWHPVVELTASTTGTTLSANGSNELSLKIRISNYINNYVQYSDGLKRDYLYIPKKNYSISLVGWRDAPKEIELDWDKPTYATFEYIMDGKHSGQFVAVIGWEYSTYDGNKFYEEPILIPSDIHLNEFYDRYKQKQNYEFIERLKEGKKLYLRFGKVFKYNGVKDSGEWDTSDVSDKYDIPRYTYEFDLTGSLKAISF